MIIKNNNNMNNNKNIIIMQHADLYSALGKHEVLSAVLYIDNYVKNTIL